MIGVRDDESFYFGWLYKIVVCAEDGMGFDKLKAGQHGQPISPTSGGVKMI
ncbi:hypothetical protein [Desulfosarcina cetonica]|uniref:hypothetical protein n=1 Tax=Desulfosarcina cetonica TaxID=90730 RepID=UPI0012EE9CF0|nr:hypothetical protein [Desulfosarcina cetonica]